MMNKKRGPHIITAISFVILIVLGLACATTPNQWKDVKYKGEDSKLLEQTSWLWVQSEKGKKFEFYPNGKLFVPDWGESSWERVGNDVKMVGWRGYLYFEGKLDLENFTISGTEYDTNGKKWDFTLELDGYISAKRLNLDGSISTQRYVDGIDTALYGRWITLDNILDGGIDLNKVNDPVIGYTFLAGNFVTFKRYGEDKANIEKLEKGTYTTDDKGTITFKVTHTYDRTEKIFLSRDEFTARQKAQGKTAAQINDAIKEYFPDRSVKYSIGNNHPGLAFLGRVNWLRINDIISRNIDFYNWVERSNNLVTVP